jgi:hypothetical protein
MNKQVIHFSILVLVILQGTFQEMKNALDISEIKLNKK